MNKNYLNLLPLMCVFVSIALCSEEAETAEHAALFEALNGGDTAAVQAYIQNHPKAVNAKNHNAKNDDDDEQTPLHMAVKRNSLETTHILLDAGANVNGQNSLQQTALHYAVENNLAEIIELLISFGADLEAPDVESWSPLFGAKTAQTAELLIRRGANVNARDGDNKTPLHYAAKEGCLLLVECLVRNGADVNVQDSVGDTPLHLAVYEKCQQTSRFLLAHGAEQNIQNSNCHTVLYEAAEVGQLDMVKELVKYGGQFHAPSLIHSPLSIAALKGNLDIVVFFVEHDPRSVYTANRSHWTALEYAVAGGHLPVVEFLLNLGAKTESVGGTSIILIRDLQDYPHQKQKVHLFLLFYGVTLRESDLVFLEQTPRLKSLVERYNRSWMHRLASQASISIWDLQELILSFVSEIKVPRPTKRKQALSTESEQRDTRQAKKQKE